MKSKRILDIENFLNNIETQHEYELKNKKIIEKYFKKYSEYLEDYKYVKNIDEFNKLPYGGYIRYVDLDENLKWGGIFLKKYKYKDMTMLLLSNSLSKTFSISFDKNCIFYKKHTSQSDKTRKLFLSYLNEY